MKFLLSDFKAGKFFVSPEFAKSFFDKLKNFHVFEVMSVKTGRRFVFVFVCI